MTAAPSGPRRASVRDVVLMAVGVMVFAFWFVGATPNRDPLWFYPVFDARPFMIAIYQQGTKVELYPGDPGFDEMVTSLNAALPRHAGYMSDFTPSAASIEAYRASGFAVEAFYPGRAKIHSRFFFAEFDELFLPLDGAYDYIGHPLLFRALNGVWVGAVMILQDNSGVRAAAEAVVNAP